MQRVKLRLLLPGLIGNILEWYEFSIYAYFASDIAHHFFSEQDRFIALLETFAVFAIGFFMRPVGAVIFGYCADRFGRKKTLPVSIIAMALATTLIGCIPTYAQIGSLAGIILIFCRLVQGVAVGGEYSSALAYILEETPERHRGLLGSFVLFGAYFGMLLGSGVSFLIAYLAEGTAYYDVGWRLSFILGIVLGGVGLYIRKKMPETEEFIQAKKDGKILQNPVAHLLCHHWKQVLQGIGMTLLPAVTSYLVFAYIPTYIVQYGNLLESQALELNTIALVVMILCIPFVGRLSDLFGRKIFLILFSCLLFFLAFFLFKLLLGDSLIAIVCAQIVLGVFSCLSEAVIPATLFSLFPVNQRCSGIALSVNVANGFFGGAAPFAATLLIHETGILLIPSAMIMAVALISGMVVLFSRIKFSTRSS